MTDKPFREFPVSSVPEHMTGWSAGKIENDYFVFAGCGHAVVIVPGPDSPSDRERRDEVEQIARLVEHAPTMLLLIETVIDQVSNGHKPDTGYLRGVVERIRHPRPFEIDDSTEG